MRRDDRDDPFDDLFREIERMMNEMMGDTVDGPIEPTDPTGFTTDTHVDVHETDEEVRVVADLPGVAKEDISLQCDGEVLTISAATDAREYDERIRLPASVNEHTASATYNNGVLEVVLEKADSASISLE